MASSGALALSPTLSYKSKLIRELFNALQPDEDDDVVYFGEDPPDLKKLRRDIMKMQMAQDKTSVEWKLRHNRLSWILDFVEKWDWRESHPLGFRRLNLLARFSQPAATNDRTCLKIFRKHGIIPDDATMPGGGLTLENQKLIHQHKEGIMQQVVAKEARRLEHLRKTNSQRLKEKYRDAEEIITEELEFSDTGPSDDEDSADEASKLEQTVGEEPGNETENGGEKHPRKEAIAKDQDIVTKDPQIKDRKPSDEESTKRVAAPEQPIGDKSHNDEHENENGAAIETYIGEPVRDARPHKDLSWSNFKWMSDSAYQEYLRIVAEQSKESDSEPSASQSNPQTDEADDKMNIDEEDWDNIGAGWIGGTVTYDGLDEEVDDEEEDDFEATWLIE
ncbi:uncharacterized protein BDZ83DRAFT_755339 [Colletotrichum acutatum]|uniref:Uncharacterized protein n=1 Tax=Glomerella acutata TaxID=27357 RepID=A0AAD8UIW1_GLOAC|nr:uncharacterized protein BDZ83DRAFT_755339 [Colletotrichum acutatum]KAK1718870.1 hypothetical protein BDZ83DRAFT_755339 [Colletotrichum acutatum]